MVRIYCDLQYCGVNVIIDHLSKYRVGVSGVDVLMVQQEVLSSSVPIYMQVLDADVQRAQYAALLKDLEEQFEFQDSLNDCENDSRQWNDEQWQKNLERYVEIGTQWESSGADSREAKVRRILTGLGFSQAMQEEGSERLSGGWRMR